MTCISAQIQSPRNLGFGQFLQLFSTSINPAILRGYAIESSFLMNFDPMPDCQQLCNKSCTHKAAQACSSHHEKRSQVFSIFLGSRLRAAAHSSNRHCHKDLSPCAIMSGRPLNPLESHAQPWRTLEGCLVSLLQDFQASLSNDVHFGLDSF